MRLRTASCCRKARFSRASSRCVFYALMFMVWWSGLFLWSMLSDRVRKTEVRAIRAETLAHEAGSSSPERVDRAPARADLDDEVCLQEARSTSYCQVRDIAYIQAAGDYTEIHLGNGEVAMVNEPLRHWELRLPDSFSRIHRSTLINLEHCEKLVHADGAWRVRLRGCPELLTASRRLAQALKTKIAERKGGLGT